MVPTASVTRQKKKREPTSAETHKMRKFIITACAIAAITGTALAATKCNFCNGTGFRGNYTCDYCHGTGRVGK
jgi:hypothetical protein